MHLLCSSSVNPRVVRPVLGALAPAGNQMLLSSRNPESQAWPASRAATPLRFPSGPPGKERGLPKEARAECATGRPCRVWCGSALPWGEGTVPAPRSRWAGAPRLLIAISSDLLCMLRFCGACIVEPPGGWNERLRWPRWLLCLERGPLRWKGKLPPTEAFEVCTLVSQLFQSTGFLSHGHREREERPGPSTWDSGAGLAT